MWLPEIVSSRTQRHEHLQSQLALEEEACEQTVESVSHHGEEGVFLGKRDGSVPHCTTAACGRACVSHSGPHCQTEEEAEAVAEPRTHGSC